MQITLQMLLIICPLVFIANFVDAIAGGGGLISLPAFLLAGLPPHLALGTNKMSSTVGIIISTVRYSKKSPPNLKVAAVCVISSLIGSYFGSNLVLLLDESIVRKVLVFILPVVAGFVVFSKKLGKSDVTYAPKGLKDYFIGAIISLIIGGYDGFYGPGTGTFLLILFLSLLKMDINSASAHTKVVNFASNISALVVFLLNGKVFITLGLISIIFSVSGNYLGSQLVLKRGFGVVKPFILVVITILFFKLIFSAS